MVNMGLGYYRRLPGGEVGEEICIASGLWLEIRYFWAITKKKTQKTCQDFGNLAGLV